MTKDKLYQISHKLYSCKDALEKHLSSCTNELFDLEDKIILYDLTNTYFEGSMRSSKIAHFGRSKEKRNDARLIVLALVVNTEGFLKYSQIFEGNLSDSTSLEKIINELSIRTSSTDRKPVIVIDAGISSESNLKLLKSKGFEYMCVARSSFSKYKVDASSAPVSIVDKQDQIITLQKVHVEGSNDRWLEVHSNAKQVKEYSMSTRFTQRFEQELEKVKKALSKKGGIKQEQKVWQRIGRIKERYPSIQKHYEITTLPGEKDTVAELLWSKKPITKKEGHYLLRTSLDETKEHIQWMIYNTIREIESTFRVLKTDLDLRPIYHKTDPATMAHLHLGLLAYWVVNTLRYQLKQKGIKNQWTDIVRTMNTQKLVTTTMVNEYNQQIIIRQCSQANQAVIKLIDALGYKSKPFYRKKSVVPLIEVQKNQTADLKGFLSG